MYTCDLSPISPLLQEDTVFSVEALLHVRAVAGIIVAGIIVVSHDAFKSVLSQKQLCRPKSRNT